jgi:hypothetical protein
MAPIRFVGLASLVVAMVAVAACSGPAEFTGAAPASPSPGTRTGDASVPPKTDRESAVAEPTDVPPVLDFSLPALGGGEVSGVELAGRHVALWFWTPW